MASKVNQLASFTDDFVLGKLCGGELLFYIGGPTTDKYRVPRYDRTSLNDPNIANNVATVYSLSSPLGEQANPGLLARIGVVELRTTFGAEFFIRPNA